MKSTEQLMLEKLQREHPLLYWSLRIICWPFDMMYRVWWCIKHLPINWWFFWPFCSIGIHSRIPAHFMHNDKEWLGCRACHRNIKRYGVYIDGDDCRKRGIYS